MYVSRAGAVRRWVGVIVKGEETSSGKYRSVSLRNESGQGQHQSRQTQHSFLAWQRPEAIRGEDAVNKANRSRLGWRPEPSKGRRGRGYGPGRKCKRQMLCRNNQGKIK